MELYPLVFDVDNKRIGFYKVEISQDYLSVIIFLFLTIFIVAGISIYRDYQMKNEEIKKNEENQTKKEKLNEAKKDIFLHYLQQAEHEFLFFPFCLWLPKQKHRQ